MDINTKLSCDDFVPKDSSSSNQLGLDHPWAQPQNKTEKMKKIPSSQEECQSILKSSSSSSSMSTGILQQDCKLKRSSMPEPPNIRYELAVAKSIMQQYSTISGDNLFDHLSDIIKRIIDERPPNVIDFFEEFSRSVREQKFHQPERFPPDGVFEETRMFKVAKKQLFSMKLPYPEDDFPKHIQDEEMEEERLKLDELKLDQKQYSPPLFYTFYERVQHLQFYWNQCGFSISSDDIFQLACSMDRLQTHPSIMQCRFWGVLNGLKASYYVVEATLSNDECDKRLVQMQKEILETQNNQIKEKILKKHTPSHIGPELTPGALGWEHYPEDELSKMQPPVLPVPIMQIEEVFDVPPEPIGLGLNRYTYFVVNSLSDDWIELPIATPKQVKASRQMKKFLTGDLEADIVSYPCFTGKEKHYLRAMISRITAGTYIAPKGYYRKMTPREKLLFEGIEEDEMGEEEEEKVSQIGEGEGEEDEEEIVDNDIVLLKNENYNASIPLTQLTSPAKWVHVRPNILVQGRVVWYDEEKARREREQERKRLERLRYLEEMGEEFVEEENEEEDAEENEGEEDDLEDYREKGPAMLTPCSNDINDETPVSWVARFTSNFTNKNERILLMQSNVWPGAYTFIFENLCESIYLGWGHKFVARNMNWPHLAAIAEEFPHGPMDFIESIDPSVEMEEAYRLSLIKKETDIDVEDEHLSDYENSSQESNDSENDTDNDND